MDLMSSTCKGEMEGEGMALKPSGEIPLWPSLDEEGNLEELWRWV